MLIDCGIHPSVKGGPAIVDEIVADIRTETGGKIDVLVVTHEHWDHVSGFSTASEMFKDFTVGEVWMAWTENAAEPLAAQLDKYKGQALAALQSASRKLDAEPQSRACICRASAMDCRRSSASSSGPRATGCGRARDAAAKLAGAKTPVYLGPDSAPISIAGLPGLRIYVLGPPRDKTLLQPRGAGRRDVSAFGAQRLAARARAERRPRRKCRRRSRRAGRRIRRRSIAVSERILSAALAGPADSDIGRFSRDHYAGPVATGAPAPAKKRGKKLPDENLTDQSWRRIDADWLGIAADLAMQLDRGVNNTSLVLAFEFTDTGRVVLFPGDAQVGNWLSWQPLKWTGRNEGGQGGRPFGADRLSQGRPSRQPERDASAARARADDQRRSVGLHPDQRSRCEKSRLGRNAVSQHPHCARGKDRRAHDPRRRRLDQASERQAWPLRFRPARSWRCAARASGGWNSTSPETCLRGQP